MAHYPGVSITDTRISIPGHLACRHDAFAKHHHFIVLPWHRVTQFLHPSIGFTRTENHPMIKHLTITRQEIPLRIRREKIRHGAKIRLVSGQCKPKQVLFRFTPIIPPARNSCATECTIDQSLDQVSRRQCREKN